MFGAISVTNILPSGGGRNQTERRYSRPHTDQQKPVRRGRARASYECLNFPGWPTA